MRHLPDRRNAFVPKFLNETAQRRQPALRGNPATGRGALIATASAVVRIACVARTIISRDRRLQHPQALCY
jgi:hypothetical protein